MVWGGGPALDLLLSAGVGLWLMFAPAALGSTGVAAHSDHLVGALIVTVAVIALAAVGRATRFLNLLLGAWVAASRAPRPGATGWPGCS